MQIDNLKVQVQKREGGYSEKEAKKGKKYLKQ